jgi:peptidoglycan hydrolase-like protein with peptidoglycan-binding domain
MFKTQSLGSTGAEAVILQAQLNSKLPTGLLLSVDGIFGPKTLARVKEFQKNNGLKVDGIVGPLTWGKLLVGPVIHKQTSKYCDNINALHLVSARAVASDFQSMPTSNSGVTLASFPSLPKLPSFPSLSGLVPKFRPLKGAPEEAIAIAVYGSSIDTSAVTLSDKTRSGRPRFCDRCSESSWALPPDYECGNVARPRYNGPRTGPCVAITTLVEFDQVHEEFG